MGIVDLRKVDKENLIKKRFALHQNTLLSDHFSGISPTSLFRTLWPKWVHKCHFLMAIFAFYAIHNMSMNVTMFTYWYIDTKTSFQFSSAWFQFTQCKNVKLFFDWCQSSDVTSLKKSSPSRVESRKVESEPSRVFK